MWKEGSITIFSFQTTSTKLMTFVYIIYKIKNPTQYINTLSSTPDPKTLLVQSSLTLGKFSILKFLQELALLA